MENKIIRDESIELTKNIDYYCVLYKELEAGQHMIKGTVSNEDVWNQKIANHEETINLLNYRLNHL